MDYLPGPPRTAQVSAPERSSELYIRDHPQRAIAVVSATHALILRYSSSPGDHDHGASQASIPRSKNDSVSAKCMIEFTSLSGKLLKDFRPLTSRPIYGTLGLIAANGEVFLPVISETSRAATVRPGETVERIGGVDFYCLSSANYDDVVPLESYEPDVADATSVYTQQTAYGQGLGRREVTLEHPCHELRKLLSNGSFYYSTDFDVTNRIQDRPINSNSFEIDDFDDAFLWNSYMISPLIKFRSRLMPQERHALDASRILTSAFRGFCKTMTIPQSSSPLRIKIGMPSYLTLISRLSCRRAGTRFNSRGIDDDGHVANFVETETTFWSPGGVVFSYAQVRGSVPVFWEQAADLVPGRQKITVTRSTEGTQPSFNKHFDELERTYGAVHVINLLSEHKPSEIELSELYRIGIRHCPLSRPGPDGSADHVLLRETHYDFHAETKGPAGYEAAKDIRGYIEDSTDGFAYYLAEQSSDPEDESDGEMEGRMVVRLQQEGVFRTNCLDCLDRTNLIQTIISQMAVEAFLGHRGEFAASDFWMRHASLWADNGDALSKIYAGTGALKTSFTRHGKMSLAGAVADVRKSVQRIYHNNFVDPSRQITIDMLLGRLVGQAPVHLFDPINDHVLMELGKRSEEYISFKNISIWVGTFNLNGRTDGINHDLSPWLFPPSLGSAQPDVFTVGFQEIVELSPQQIMNSDPSRKHEWEQAVKRTLNRRQAALGGEKYVLLRSGQLVGAALCIFVKTSALVNIKNVEGSVKKTGMSGMAGNKGAVAIRFDYAKTQLCFVTAHLAAGFANYDERNRDYATIHHGLRFQRNRGIDDHDAVIWLGDFNYRIGLSLETATAMVKRRDLESLYENDQLNLQMVAGMAFPYYSEARIAFMPTYKFDIGTDQYDTSEKARIPAWTDRILRKGQSLRQLAYDSAPLKFSDHRPVYALFECKVSVVNEALRESISQDIYRRRKTEVENSVHTSNGDDTEDEDLIDYHAIEPGLPLASSDRQKWWLGNKQPARAHIPIPSGRDGQPMALNPNRPSNPFGHEEHDWISVERSSSRASFSSLSSSPYEKVMLPHGMMGKPTTRRLVTGQDLPGKFGRMNLELDGAQSQSQSHQSQSQSQPPPLPPPRRSTTGLSSTAGSSGYLNMGGLHRAGTMPLSSSSHSQLSTWSSTSTGNSTGTGTGTGTGLNMRQSPSASTAMAAAPRVAISSQAPAKSVPPPIAKKPKHLVSSSTSTTGTNTSSMVNTYADRNAIGGPAPARHGPPVSSQQQQQQERQKQRGAVDLLDSLDEGGQDSMCGWETLQPSR